MLRLPWLSRALLGQYRRFTTGTAVHVERQLVRDFIHDSLYNPKEGYFSGGPSVGSPSKPIDFRSLGNELAYFNHVQALYASLQVSWLTPVEIFQPYYGAAIARFMADRWLNLGSPGPLHIFEIGGGTGTLAQNVLDTLREEQPRIYSSCKYKIIEISSKLAAAQQARLHADAEHSSRFLVERRDAAMPWASGAVHDRPCFVLAMEVLDNLPHDKVVWGKDGWQQAMVVLEKVGDEADCAPKEELEEGPVKDKYIQRVLTEAEALDRYQKIYQKTGFMQWITRSRGEAFLPTGALRLFDALHAALPRHGLIAADFDELPEVVIPGLNAPLVASTIRGSTVDHNTYLVPRGSADIFFPTDFELVSRIHAAAANLDQNHSRFWCKTAAFMCRWATPGCTDTRSGYNPLLSDYSNTSFLLAGNPDLCSDPLATARS